MEGLIVISTIDIMLHSVIPVQFCFVLWQHLECIQEKQQAASALTWTSTAAFW
jgi:hypothetical protein